MDSKPLSAVDAISPAFERTRRYLFKPFGFRIWARFATIGLITGEFAGGGFGGGNFHIPQYGGGTSKDFLPPPPWLHAPWIPAFVAVSVVVVFVFVVLWMYWASVYRFILFDAVLTGRSELGPGWRRWRDHGRRLFWFVIVWGLLFSTALVLLIGVPLLFAFVTGLFKKPGEHVVALLLGGITLFCLFVVLMLFGVLVWLFTKDFVVPLMAVENLGVMDAWRRLLTMVRAEGGSYVLYVLMKIVLALGSAIVFGIADLFVILLLLVPVGGGAAAIILLAGAAGLSWNPYTVSAAIFVGTLAFGGLLWVLAFVSAPAVVFFQSYVLHFFGSRHPALAAQLSPSPPAPPPAPAAVPAT